MKFVLGIETSCDETAAAVVSSERIIRSNILATQIDLHGPFGGVVPELACRRHAEVIDAVVDSALASAGIEAAEISALGVTGGPGLIGALLVGVSFAKAFAYAKKIPLIPINHLEGHLLAVLLSAQKAEPSGTPTQRRQVAEDLPYPLVGLVVSGGHTNLYLLPRAGVYERLGRTLDDAAGEAFDKGAKMMGLGYPGGPVIDRLASEGDPKRFRLPRPYPSLDRLDFSFSGLKTALGKVLKEYGGDLDRRSRDLPDLAAALQHAIVGVLVDKTLQAARRHRARGIIVSGGVAANSRLRSEMAQRAAREGFELLIPAAPLCTDNGAMIAAAALERLERGEEAGFDYTPRPDLPLGC